MPAKRKSKSSRRIVRKKRKEREGKVSKSRLITILFVFAALYFFTQVTTKTWGKTDKLSLMTSNETGSVKIMVFDPSRKKVTSFSIPQEMQVKASRQFGTWRITGLKVLSENEGYGNQL